MTDLLENVQDHEVSLQSIDPHGTIIEIHRTVIEYNGSPFRTVDNPRNTIRNTNTKMRNKQSKGTTQLTQANLAKHKQIRNNQDQVLRMENLPPKGGGYFIAISFL